jgi:hypothetical protein
LAGALDINASQVQPGTFAPGDFSFPNNLKVTEYLDLMEVSTPATPPADTARIYAFDFHGETRLRVELPDGVRFDMMADNTIIARNTSGGTITKGQVVYVSGASGNVPTIALAQANSLTTLSVVGVAQETMNDGDFGTVNFSGTVIFDTSAFMAGANVYVSATTPGAVTSTRPTYPDIIQHVGVVLVSGVGNGELLIAPQERDTGLSPWAGVTNTPTTRDGYGITDVYTKTELDGGQLNTIYYTETEIDALFAALTTGDLSDWPADAAGVLTNDGAGVLTWEAAGAGTIDGSGTAGKLAKWSDSDTLADSLLSESGTEATVTGSLILDQGAADDAILSLRSSDVAHGMTDFAPTDVYATFGKVSANGGFFLRGLRDSNAAFNLTGAVTSGTATKTTAARGPVFFNGILKSGTGGTNLGSGNNILAVADNGTTRFIVDADGRVDIVGAGSLYINGTQILSTRATGWAAATGTATRTTFATASVTLANLAQRVKALIDDLISHGIIGA